MPRGSKWRRQSGYQKETFSRCLSYLGMVGGQITCAKESAGLGGHRRAWRRWRHLAAANNARGALYDPALAAAAMVPGGNALFSRAALACHMSRNTARNMAHALHL